MYIITPLRFNVESAMALLRQVLLAFTITALMSCTSMVRAHFLRTVAISGKPASGTGSGVVFRDFSENFELNNRGQIAFRGFLAGTNVGSANDTGIWSESDVGELRLVAREGEQALSDEPGVIYNGLAVPFLNDLGHIAFADQNGLWSNGVGGGLQLVAKRGDQAPGAEPGVSFGTILALSSINNNGEIAFQGFLTGPDVNGLTNDGIWSNRSGSGIQLVVRGGQQAPDTNPGVSFRFDLIRAPAFNESGQVAFDAFLSGASVEAANRWGIWSEGGGEGLRMVTRAGNHAPGTELGLNFNINFTAPLLNDAGETAFRGSLSGIGVDSSNSIGIWSEGGGSGLKLVVRSGDHAPGTDESTMFAAPLPPLFNDDGHTAFRAELQGNGVGETNDWGIWKETAGDGLDLVVREGEVAPGTEAGVKFRSFSNLAFNDNGQTAFLGKLVGEGVNSPVDDGLWAEDVLGNLTLIVREGDQIDVDEGPLVDLRTVERIAFPDSTTGINDLGQVGFFATFTDGSQGIFLSNAVAVPEPTSIALCLLVSCAAFSLRYK